MDPYRDREKRELLRALSAGTENPACPRCGGACAVIRTGPLSDVAYVRDRVLIRCSGCLRNLAVDAGEGIR